MKFCPNIPLGDLSWNSLREVMWRHYINGFSNSKLWKNWQENVHVGVENDWSGSFVLLYGWNNEDVRWGFLYSNPLGSYEQFWVLRRAEKLRLLITSQWIWIEKNLTVHLHYFIHRVRQNCQTNHFPFLRERFLVSFFSKFWIWKPLMWWCHMASVNEFHERLPRGMFGQNFTSLQGVEGV